MGRGIPRLGADHTVLAPDLLGTETSAQAGAGRLRFRPLGTTSAPGSPLSLWGKATILRHSLGSRMAFRIAAIFRSAASVSSWCRAAASVASST